MSDFLEDWDFALRSAREHGEIVWMRRFVTNVVHDVVLYPQTAKDLYEGREDLGESQWVWSGRTMHPAFMAPPMPKHDPRRDA